MLTFMFVVARKMQIISSERLEKEIAMPTPP